MKKSWIIGACTFFTLQLAAFSGDVPETLAAYFEEETTVKAQLISVVPPAGFEMFVQKISQVAQKNPEWFQEHSKKTPAGSPLPVFDEKLGMGKETYADFVQQWGNREVKKLADTTLLLQESSEGVWIINGSGVSSALSLLRYQEKTNSFTSPNGELLPIVDVSAPSDSLLGAWKGKEWRFLSENTLTHMKENVALGKSADGKYCFLIYRIQEVTRAGRPIFDQSLMIRFAAQKMNE